ncbi:MAG TPA: peptidoglycan-binding protein [Candidatus Eisenbacteria bacterium]|uniref:Peptidoglycan-binding protein n=1 Tax=Eiseniibacteriota bacterium TaxID=2212470 RepID=A0A7V2F3J0_UNCEI|nr:peptidoglycan-binding protein [Candidatus Eisenbacteria bacterium]
MKFVHVSVHRAVAPFLVLSILSCGGGKGDRARDSSRSDWRTTNDLANAGREDPNDLEMRESLRLLGYDPGPAGEQIGPKARSALLRYQRDYGLPASGIAGPATRARLVPASVFLMNGYRPGGSRQRRPGLMQLEPRYPGDIAPLVGADDGIGLSPCAGPRDDFYRILRSGNRETERQGSPER